MTQQIYLFLLVHTPYKVLVIELYLKPLEFYIVVIYQILYIECNYNNINLNIYHTTKLNIYVITFYLVKRIKKTLHMLYTTYIPL